MRHPNCFTELVTERADVLLNVIETPARVVEGIGAAVEAESIVGRLVLTHDRASGLAARILSFPRCDIVAGRSARLHDPIVAQLQRSKQTPSPVSMLAPLA